MFRVAEPVDSRRILKRSWRGDSWGGAGGGSAMATSGGSAEVTERRSAMPLIVEVSRRFCCRVCLFLVVRGCATAPGRLRVSAPRRREWNQPSSLVGYCGGAVARSALALTQ